MFEFKGLDRSYLGGRKDRFLSILCVFLFNVSNYD